MSSYAHFYIKLQYQKDTHSQARTKPSSKITNPTGMAAFSGVEADMRGRA